MPAYIVKQPNGLYGRFSTIVDDFTHLNMTEEEVRQELADHLGKLEIEEKIQRAKNEEMCSTMHYVERGSLLARWHSCLRSVQTIHGEAKMKEREEVGNAICAT